MKLGARTKRPWALTDTGNGPADPKPVAALRAGMVKVMALGPMLVGLTARPPTYTVAAAPKFSPLMVTTVPPDSRPAVGVMPVTLTSAGSRVGVAIAPVHGVPALAWPPTNALQYIARSTTKGSSPTLSRNTAKRRPCSSAYLGSLTASPTTAGQMLARALAGTVVVVVTPLPSSVAKVARTWMARALGLTTRKNESKATPDGSSPCRPSAKAQRLSGWGIPATTWPSFQGKTGVAGSPADGVPQYMARSATIGMSLSRRTEKAVAGSSRLPALSGSWSVQMLKRLRGRTV